MIVLMVRVVLLPDVLPTLQPTHLLTVQPERTDVSIPVIIHVIQIVRPEPQLLTLVVVAVLRRMVAETKHAIILIKLVVHRVVRVNQTALAELIPFRMDAAEHVVSVLLAVLLAVQVNPVVLAELTPFRMDAAVLVLNVLLVVHQVPLTGVPSTQPAMAIVVKMGLLNLVIVVAEDLDAQLPPAVQEVVLHLKIAVDLLTQKQFILANTLDVLMADGNLTVNIVQTMKVFAKDVRLVSNIPVVTRLRLSATSLVILKFEEKEPFPEVVRAETLTYVCNFRNPKKSTSFEVLFLS